MTTNAERLSSGILVGRKPHEPTFTRNAKNCGWAVCGEDRTAILDVERAVRRTGGTDTQAIQSYVTTINGPAQVWFNAAGTIHCLCGKSEGKIDVFKVNAGGRGYSHSERVTTLDISLQDKPGFTRFKKTSPDGKDSLARELAEEHCKSTGRDCGKEAALGDTRSEGAAGPG